MLPVRAKSRIVVLGNHEDRDWSKSDRFAPVLRSDSLRLLVSLAVEQRRVLKQGDCKNAFCQSELPLDETTIVKPPSGDPDAGPNEYWLLRKTLYGLRRSPRHSLQTNYYQIWTKNLRIQRVFRILAILSYFWRNRLFFVNIS